MTFKSVACIPKYENRFCLDEDKSYNWKDYNQTCSIINNSTSIDCPQHRMFTSFDDFKAWTSKTTTVKIRGFIETNINGTTFQTLVMETKSVVVTPMFRCPTIDLVRPQDLNFSKNSSPQISI